MKYIIIFIMAFTLLTPGVGICDELTLTCGQMYSNNEVAFICKLTYSEFENSPVVSISYTPTESANLVNFGFGPRWKYTDVMCGLSWSGNMFHAEPFFDWCVKKPICHDGVFGVGFFYSSFTCDSFGYISFGGKF